MKFEIGAHYHFDDATNTVRMGASAPSRELSLDLGEDIAAMLRPLGWEVEAEVIEDHYSWVDTFRAIHATHGAVGGSFDSGVEADSAESLAALIDGINTVGGWRYWDHADI